MRKPIFPTTADVFPVPAPATTNESEESWGEEDDWGDEDDDLGFEDTTIATKEKLAAPAPWTLKGTRRYDWAAWAERLSSDPLAKGRQSLDLEAYFKYDLNCSGCTLRGKFSGHGEYDLAYAHDRDKYDPPTLDTYEWLVQARENYGSFSNGFFEQKHLIGSGDEVTVQISCQHF